MKVLLAACNGLCSGLTDSAGGCRLLEAFLAEIGVTSEEFAAACSTAVQAGGDRAFVFQQIMAVDDFQTFRRMMTKRNYEIEMDALKQMEMIQQKAAQDAGQPPPPPPPETPGQEDLGEFGDIDLEEQRQLEEALALSRMTFEQPQQTAQVALRGRWRCRVPRLKCGVWGAVGGGGGAGGSDRDVQGVCQGRRRAPSPSSSLQLAARLVVVW